MDLVSRKTKHYVMGGFKIMRKFKYNFLGAVCVVFLLELKFHLSNLHNQNCLNLNDCADDQVETPILIGEQDNS